MRLDFALLATTLAATSASLMLAGCNESDDPRCVRTSVGRGGGQVSSHDGVLTLVFVPGALENAEEIEICPSDSPPLIFGPAYRVKPDVSLQLDAEVTYARRLPNDPTGVAVAAIRKADFEAGNGNWIKLPSIEVDTQNELVTATDSELSLFYGLLQGDDVSGTTSSTTAGVTTVGDTDPPDSAEESSTGEDTESGGGISHAADIQPIWNDNCLGAGCHSAGQTAPTLEGDAYGVIVNGVSTTASIPLIAPGESLGSYITHKLLGSHLLTEAEGGCGCAGGGSLMPLGAAKLDDDTIALVRQWIDEGAAP